MRRIVLILALALGLACQAASAAAQEGHAESSGTVRMSVGRGAMIVSITGGSGALTYQGQEYPFKVGGMGLGLLGVSKVEAEGEVFDLKRVEDFTGAYAQGGADYSFGDGKGVLWLRNTKGVTLRLRSVVKGVSLAAAGEGLLIQWGEIRQGTQAGKQNGETLTRENP
ncbi:hypothetical protein NNJEOMEG_00242 [Fundidesulfovibrio magnetotacticus]|uniref:DUF1134 domain-containing protein n=1 Tax=Fundidesulfovibrio magnetotacticus TaxID=2730080 RepID=A0A6V8LS31_9BACT|nr:hypothetical protein [Fundidesulfovibrio magnetotacticus]GFK92417.1 hypothetical protein NNJEOMEG_00242 [Fundidesulfovibrio magnetotacticus]